MSIQFFTADDGIHGSELWVTDGTPSGTHLVKDINPGVGSSGVSNLVQSNGIMYFTANDGTATHLWRSDGSSAGTFALTSSTNGDNTSNLINVNGTLYFLGSDSVHGSGLFKSDGTLAGTSFVKAVSSPSQFTAVGNTLFFQASDGANGFELWKSDGTDAGTGLVKDIFPGSSSSSLGNFTASGGKLYFTADDGTHGQELWVSDGTAANTVMVKDVNPGPSGSGIGGMFAAGGHLFFIANDGAHGNQLWTTDGTAANTVALASPLPSSTTFTSFNNQFFYVASDNITSGSAIYTSDGSSVTRLAHLSSFGGQFFNLGAQLIFQGDDGTHGTGLYTFNGSSVNFVAAASPQGGFSQAVVSNGKLFYVGLDSAHGNELWVSDGTASGTHITADVNPGPYDANIHNISPVGSGVVFTATRPDVGTELFFSDGTAAGTGLLSDVNPTGNHSPSLSIGSAFFGAGSSGYFAADDGVHGNELWTGDGTAAGTHIVTDLVVGATSSSPGSFFSSAGKIFFTADDGVHGRQLYTSDGTTVTQLTSANVGGQPYNDARYFFTLASKFYYFGYDASNIGGYALFTSDGTQGGTTKLAHLNDFNSFPKALGSSVIFFGNDGPDGYGLYKFDGTGLAFVKTVSDFGEPVVSGGNLYFRSTDGGNGSELWVTDGTAAGTHLTADINPGSYASNPTNITSLNNGSVVFTAYNPNTGTELYTSDGTSAGTQLLSDVNATGNHAVSLGINSNIFDAGGKGYFAADDGIHGNELWTGDGTAAGSHMITDLVVGAGASSPQSFFSSGGKIFFTADDGVHGRQLYTSDGTTVTQLTSANVGGQPYNDARYFFTLASKFYYFGYDASNIGGYALFTSDGTQGGTTKLAHLNDFNSFPKALGSSVIFFGNDGPDGYGLYKFDGTGLAFVKTVSDFGEPVVSGGNLYFRSTDGGNGSELWVTDGTAAGTHLTADINPGSYASNPTNITSLNNGSVVFTAYNPNTGTELYTSDGTSAGTQLLSDVNATGNHAVSLGINSNIFDAGGKGYFAADDGIHGNELWTGDGTAAGSHMITDLVVGAGASSPQSFFSSGGKIFFTADDGVHGRQLYTSDGTTVTQLTSANVGGQPYNDARYFFTLAGKFYYFGYDASNIGGYALFTSDGTQGGTTKLAHLNDFNSFPKALGSSVIFFGNDGPDGYGLYKFDGTGLAFVKTVSDFGEPVVSGGNLYFRSTDSGNGSELWVTDGTAAGTHLTADINPGSAGSNPQELTATTGGLFFTADDGTHGRELFVTDGTSSGTKLVADLFPDSQGSDPANLTAFGSKVFFTANYYSSVDGAHGRELFISDGTNAGTFMVKDINPGSGDSNPSNLFVSNGKLYFSAYDPSAGTSHLWVSDGTTAGTQIVPSGDGHDDNNPSNFLKVDATHFYFTANAGLFYSDGTTPGTLQVGSTAGFDANKYSIVNGQLLYQSYDGANGVELWRSDGTVAGTYRVTDTQIPNSSNATNFAFTGTKVFFSANDGVHGQELWVTDGTTGGTSLVKDINPGSGDSNPSNLFVSNGKLYFSAYDPSAGTSHLWVSDGTTAGTQIVPSGDGHDDNNPSNFLKVDATHFYFTANAGLFYSDGTTPGTLQVGSTAGFDANKYSIVNGQLLYQSYDGANGVELWRSDGTVAGTYRVTDTQIPNSSNATNFAFTGTKVFFSANDGVHGQELWVTDGTTGGTSLVKDINPGSGDSNPSNLFVSNGKLYFSAYDPSAGTSHLWVSDGTTAGTQIVPSGDGHDDNNPSNFLKVDATHFYFTANAGLFYSDGTTPGTLQVGSTAGFDANKYSIVNGQLLYQSYDGANGVELWRSDGTVAGTYRVTDTQIPNSSNPTSFSAIDNFPPTINGTAQTPIADNQTTHPFANVVIADADTPVQTMTVTVTLDDPAKGSFTSASLAATGFVGGGVAGSYTFTGSAAQATAAIDALVFAPTQNRLVVGDSETTQFNVTVDDGHGGSVISKTTSVTATSANDAPIAIADSAAVNEDATAQATTRSGGLLANDTDADVGETATLTVKGAHFGAGADTLTPGDNSPVGIVGTYGTLNLSADGTYSYTPNSAAAEALPQGQAASDVFSYTVTDVHGATSVATVTFNITGQNDAPVATGETIAVNEDATAQATTRSGGLLANDTDVDTGETATLTVKGAHFGAGADTLTPGDNSPVGIVGTYGTLNLSADGTYSYTPNSAAAEALPQGQAASDVFSYTVTDVHGATSVATVTFNITGQNDAPVATGETIAVNEDATAQATTRSGGLLANDTDVDTGETATLTVKGAHFGAGADTLTPGDNSPVGIVGTYGTLNLSADGTYSYTPNSAAAEALPQGQAASDVFSYTVTDVHGATSVATVTFNITGQNDAPVATGETIAVNEDATAQATTRSGGLLANDTDVDTGETATLTVKGAHFGAGADTLTPGDNSPVGIVGTYGTLNLSADGTYSYTPNSAAAEALPQGQAASDVFSYTVTDVHGATSVATVTFNITGQNDAPVATGETIAVNEDATAQATTRSGGLLANDTDVDTGETATLTVKGAHFGAGADTLTPGDNSPVGIVGTYGTLNLSADGTYSYTPNSAAAEALPQGQAASDVFSYTVTDVHGATSVATVTFNITGQNDAPVATGETIAVNEDATAQATTRSGGLLANDTDVDTGETATLTVKGAHFGAGADTLTPGDNSPVGIVGTYGTLNLSADGTYSYTPNSAAAEALPQGQAASDVFSYTVTDVHGATSVATVTFNITGQNDAPVATGETIAVNEDATAQATTRSGGLLANDTDVDTGETATLTVKGAHFGAGADTLTPGDNSPVGIVGTYGTLNLSADGTYSYTPNSAAAEALPQGQAASDVFSYTVTDVHGATSVATVTFNITGQNDAPVATGETIAVNEDATAQATTRSGGLLANDTDVDTGETATLTVKGAHFGAGADTLTPGDNSPVGIVGTYGTLNLSADGTYSYTPNSAAAEALPQGQAASDVFSYTVTDVHGATSVATVTFNITGQNDAPVATGETIAVNEDATAQATTRSGGLLANDTDVDTGETATLTVKGAHFGAGADTLTPGDNSPVGIVGTYGTLNLSADGTYSYTPNSAAAEALPQGQAASDVFSYTVTDVHGATSVATVTFNITGQNDPAIITGPSTGDVTEAGGVNNTTPGVPTATGDLNSTDVDNPNDAWQAVSAGAATSGGYGTYALSASGVWTYTLDDNNAAVQALNVNGTLTDTFTVRTVDGTPQLVTITIHGQDDAAVAQPDAVTTNEATVFNGNVLSDNGSGADSDVDGPPLSVGKVNGSAANVGTQITLASGALLTLNANGTFSYDPNHKFDYLVSPATAAATGAANGSATDSFTYSLAGGGTTTVTVTINGVDGAGDQLRGTAGNDTITGTPQPDTFDLSQGGNDTVSGGAGDDSFYFGAAFTAADTVDGGAGTNDQIGLKGNYTGANALVLGPNTIANVEVIAVLPGFSYSITTVDANVAAGQQLTIFAGNLGAGDNLTFNGSAETNGSFRVFGGLGTDIITTGAGDDGIYFGPGKFDPSVDRIDGGAGTNDQLALDGNYTTTLDGIAIKNIEVIALLHGPSASPNTFNITTADSLVGLGQTMTVWGASLDTSLTFNGSAETDGSFKIYGGHAADTITGGAGNDWIYGGLGADVLNGGLGSDTFHYEAVAESTGSSYDQIVGFVSGVDKIDLPGTVAAVDPTVNGGALNTATFNADLSAAIGAGQLHAGDAVLFHPDSGTLAGTTFLIVDANGIAGYQPDQDYVIQLVTPPPIIIPTDFV